VPLLFSLTTRRLPVITSLSGLTELTLTIRIFTLQILKSSKRSDLRNVICYRLSQVNSLGRPLSSDAILPKVSVSRENTLYRCKIVRLSGTAISSPCCKMLHWFSDLRISPRFLFAKLTTTIGISFSVSSLSKNLSKGSLLAEVRDAVSQLRESFFSTG
jgi:hypothetical protein